MKSSVFHYPYEKVFRRAQGALSQMGMKIVSFDAVKGKITAHRRFTLTEPELKVELEIEQLEHQNIRVVVKNVVMKKKFFHRNQEVDAKEEEILQTIASVI